MKMYELFLTCPKGLEEVCKKELERLSLSKIKILQGGLSFTGTILDLYKINLHSRTGMNLLVKLESFNFLTIKDFYDYIYKYNWGRVLDPKMTFSIDTNIITDNPLFNNSQFPSLKAKDAICDKLMYSRKRRPYVAKDAPDLNIKLIIDKNTCILYANSSGKPLYIRGYKKNFSHQASINESLASGLILLSNWNKEITFLDPMCGSGTICLEASMIKRNIPAGINRSFGFQNWLNYDQDLYFSILKKAEKSIDEISKNNVFGSDIDPESVDTCNSILSSFNLNLGIHFSLKNITNFRDKKIHHIVSNPPYEVRIGEEKDIQDIHRGIKRFLTAGNSLYFIYPEDSDFIKKNYDFRHLTSIYNGGIKCGFYEIQGSLK